MQGVLEEMWLLERELGNVQELLRDFEAKRQVQWGGRQGSPTHVDACPSAVETMGDPISAI